MVLCYSIVLFRIFFILWCTYLANGGELQLEQCGMLKDRKDFCSHQVCVLFFAYALRNPKKYIACPCDDYIKFLKGECDCSYHGTGQPIGELTK